MKELIRTNDVVLLSYLQVELEGRGIDFVVLDTHTSILEGSLGILPRRVMVTSEDERAAQGVLEQILKGHDDHG